MLEGEAAAEPPAEPGDATGGHRKILVLGHAERDRLLVRREPAGALHPAAEPVVPAESRALARPHRAQLDAAVQTVAERSLEAGRVRPFGRLVGEDDPRAVEDELGRDGLERDPLLANDLAKDP
jgi:hypothetical protein